MDTPQAHHLLIEVPFPALTTDVELLGSRLLVYSDHLEVLDRNDTVQTWMLLREIEDVSERKAFIGSALVVVSSTGQRLAIKGLHPATSHEVWQLIYRRRDEAGDGQAGDREPRVPKRPHDSGHMAASWPEETTDSSS